MKYNLGDVNHRSAQASVTSYCGIWPKIAESVFIADGARITGDVVIADSCTIWFNTVLRGDVNYIHIGEETNIQDGTVIHGTFKKHATTIGKRVSIGHLAMIHGCTIEDECLIGMGSLIMDGVVIGAQSLIGAGALITQGTIIPPRSLVMGRPGKVIRQVTEEEFQGFAAVTQRYLEYAKGYNFSA